MRSLQVQYVDRGGVAGLRAVPRNHVQASRLQRSLALWRTGQVPEAQQAVPHTRGQGQGPLASASGAAGQSGAATNAADDRLATPASKDDSTDSGSSSEDGECPAYTPSVGWSGPKIKGVAQRLPGMLKASSMKRLLLLHTMRLEAARHRPPAPQSAAYSCSAGSSQTASPSPSPSASASAASWAGSAAWAIVVDLTVRVLTLPLKARLN